MKQKWFIFLPVIFLLLIVTLANTGYLPRSIRQLYDFPFGDKVGHFLLMGLINFLLNWMVLASRSHPKPASVIWKVSLAFALFTTLEEFSQQFFPRRTFSLLDLGYSYAGIAVSALLVFRLRR